MERLAMYECVIGQVYSLCSSSSVSYELHADRQLATSERTPDAVVRARVYWYCFVHEAIKTGLKGGRLVMYASLLCRLSFALDEA